VGELIRRNPLRTQERLMRLRRIVGPEKNPKRRFASDFDNDDYLKWTAISSDKIDYELKPLVRGAGRLGELVDWCDDNCNGIYVIGKSDKIYFEDENDAAMFALVWK
jgi:hypothetical protein